jgi:hypothetical protein
MEAIKQIFELAAKEGGGAFNSRLDALLGKLTGPLREACEATLRDGLALQLRELKTGKSEPAEWAHVTAQLSLEGVEGALAARNAVLGFLADLGQLVASVIPGASGAAAAAGARYLRGILKR